MRPRRFTWLLAIVSGAVLAAPLHGASDHQSDFPTPQAALKALDSPHLAEREAASEYFADGQLVTEKRLVEFLARPDLSPEQRQRLLDAHWERFLSNPRAAIGVSLTTLEQHEGVLITRTNEGFPAHTHQALLPGDIVLAIGDQRVGSGVEASQVLKREIISHEPGDVVPMTIRRPAEPPAPAELIRPDPETRVALFNPRNASDVNVRVPLGSWQTLVRLNNNNPAVRLNSGELRDAWRVRLRRWNVRMMDAPIFRSTPTGLEWTQYRRPPVGATSTVGLQPVASSSPQDELELTRQDIAAAQERRRDETVFTNNAFGIDVVINTRGMPPNQAAKVKQTAAELAEIQTRIRALQREITDPTRDMGDRAHAQNRLERLTERYRAILEELQPVLRGGNKVLRRHQKVK